MLKAKVFILNKRGNVLRYLKESRTERKESRLDMARALCERWENSKEERELGRGECVGSRGQRVIRRMSI